MHTKELIMYSRTIPCPFIATAKQVLSRENIPYREIHIDVDEDARQRVLAWTGFESVPTIVVAENGDILPLEDPSPLDTGQSPRGIDRGMMITEPNYRQFQDWLEKHGFVKSPKTD